MKSVILQFEPCIFEYKDMTLQKQLEYVHPEVLVDTQWAEDHLKDPRVRIVEVDYDSSSNYKLGHIPGSVLFDWKKDINEPLSRNILSRSCCRKLVLTMILH